MHLSPQALAARLATALERLQALDVERRSLSLPAEEGDGGARERLSQLDRSRAKLIDDLERLQAAKTEADGRIEAVTAAAIERDRAQRAEVARKLAGECAAQVAVLDGLTGQIVDVLKTLGDSHAALYAATGGIPANGPLQNFMAALPTRLRQALGKSGIVGFAGSGLIDWSGTFADDYPGPEYFAGLVQARTIGEIERTIR